MSKFDLAENAMCKIYQTEEETPQHIVISR